MFKRGGKAAINREVIRRKLDHRLLPRAQKRDVGRTDARFDQQRVFQRNDLDQVHAGLDHAADGVDLDLFDDTRHQCPHDRARYPVLESSIGGAQSSMLSSCKVQFLHRLGVKSRRELMNLLLCFLQR